MSAFSQPVRKYELDCGHALYLRIAPKQHDQLWCSRCQQYEYLLAHSTKGGTIYDPSGEFRAERVGKRLLGFCLHEACKSLTEPVARSYSNNYGHLRTKMHSHYMKEHTRWMDNVREIPKVSALPPNSPPPF